MVTCPLVVPINPREPVCEDAAPTVNCVGKLKTSDVFLLRDKFAVLAKFLQFIRSPVANFIVPELAALADVDKKFAPVNPTPVIVPEEPLTTRALTAAELEENTASQEAVPVPAVESTTVAKQKDPPPNMEANELPPDVLIVMLLAEVELLAI